MTIYKKLKALFIIIRPLNCLISSISVLIAYLISIKNSEIAALSSMILAILAAGLTCAAGNVINDYYDIEIDKINKPNRVLPLRHLSQKEALLFYAVIVLVSLDLAFLIGLIPFIIVLLSNILLFFYSFYFKRIVLAGNIIVALLTGMAFLFGAVVAGDTNSGIIPAIFAFLANLSREIIKDIEDIKGDSARGVNTVPSEFGIKKSAYLILTLSVLLVLFTFIPMIYALYKIEYFAVIALLVNPIIIISIKDFIYLIVMEKEISPKSLKRSSNLLKLSMVLGLLAIYIGV